MKLSDEDVERIADALAKRVAPQVVPQPIWIDPRGYYPWMQYPSYSPYRVTSGVSTTTRTGTLIN